MKKIVFLLVVATFFASCNNKTTETATSDAPAVPVVNIAEGTKLPIAVVNVDSLLNNYDLALEANETLMKKQEDARLDLNQRAKNLQNEMVDFQNKLENQAFLSRERAESEQRRLMKKEQDLQLLEQTKSQELMAEQQELSLQMRDSINNVINAINATGKYHLIISTSALNDNVLFSAPEYNITDEVIEMLNDRYSASKK